MVSTSTYQNRYETFNFKSEAGVEAITATDLTLQDNLITGSERIAYHVPTLDCDDTSGRYRNNKAYANVLGGVVITHEDSLTQTDCAKISGFTVWKTHDYGIYYQNEISLIVDNSVLIENTNGLFPIVIKPDSVLHEYANKTVQVRNVTFVGQTESFDCIDDAAPSRDDNYALSDLARPSYPPSSGMVGLIFSNFYKKDNGLPTHPWKGCMAYPALGGMTLLKDVTFAKYTSGTCKSNFAVSTNIANDDGMHPIESKRIYLIDVDETNKIVYHRPNVA